VKLEQVLRDLLQNVPQRPETDRRRAQLRSQQRIAEDLAKQMVATPAIQEQADAGGQSRGALSFGRSA
jgi:hypothetical protein